MKKVVFVGIALVTLGTGCVTGRRITPLDVPQLTVVAEPTKPALAIAPVSDERQFENKPDEPSTPSIDGDVTQVAREQLKVMIGRQRNSYGKAMGDIALPSDQSVEGKVKELVELGFKRRGYAIAAPDQAGDSAGVKINEFWAWFTPGFASVSFEARVNCTVSTTIGGESRSFDVLGYGINNGQVASNANWQLAYQRAFEDFLKNFDTAVAAAGL